MKALKTAYLRMRITALLQETEDGIEWARLDVPYTCCIKSPKKESKLKGLKSYIAYQITPSVSSLPEYRAYKCGSRGWDRGSRPPLPLENHKLYEFL